MAPSGILGTHTQREREKERERERREKGRKGEKFPRFYD